MIDNVPPIAEVPMETYLFSVPVPPELPEEAAEPLDELPQPKKIDTVNSRLITALLPYFILISSLIFF
jgi:hypothetical protein